MQRTRVAHCIRGFLFPTETFVGNQIASLRTYQPIVICHHRESNSAYNVDRMLVLNEDQSRLHALAGSASYGLFRTLLPFQVERAVKWLKSQEAGLFHFHYGVDAAFFAPLKRKFSIPAVVSFYGYDVSSFPGAQGGTGRMYLRRAFRGTDILLAMSEDMKKDLISLGAPAENIQVHYYGSDCRRFKNEGRMFSQKPNIEILVVGTLEKKKGQHFLLDVLGAIKKERGEIRISLKLVGDGPLRKELERRIQQSDLSKEVRIVGHVPYQDPRLVKFYLDADIFVHYATTQPDGDKEGIPGTIVEAMASGLPVVATRHAGIPEVIDDGREGILVREGDLSGLKNAILRLCDDVGLRKSLGQAAARRALGSLDLSTRTRALERIYDQLLRRRDAAGSQS